MTGTGEPNPGGRAALTVEPVTPYPSPRCAGRTWAQTRSSSAPTRVKRTILPCEVSLKHTWYPIELPIRYEGPAAGSVKGCGRTLAINTRKVRFASDQDLPVGLDVLLRISWPAQRPDGTGLSLSIFGRIERSESHEVEVTVSRHEFRTRRSEPSERLGNLRAMHAG